MSSSLTSLPAAAGHDADARLKEHIQRAEAIENWGELAADALTWQDAPDSAGSSSEPECKARAQPLATLVCFAQAAVGAPVDNAETQPVSQARLACTAFPRITLKTLI